MKEPYDIYVEKFGKIKSGGELQDNDYGEGIAANFENYDEVRRLAVSLAAQDADTRNMRTKSECKEELNRLQS